MSKNNNISLSWLHVVYAKLSDVAQLYKLRLGSLVVFSSLIGYMLVAPTISIKALVLLALGGFLVTGASNTFNQIFEKEVDALMNRTHNRPLPTGRMSITEASLWAGIAAIVGLLILTIYFNPTTGLLAAISLILYAFIYTPLKRVHPIAVFVGAIPGALPPMIGAVAFNGIIGNTAIYLFLLQFIWQFPHFWAIAWHSFEDYKKADIMLLPSKGGRDLNSAINIALYTSTLFPLTLVLFIFGYFQMFAFVGLIIAAIIFIIPSIQLLMNLSDANAKKVMFASFIYLPLVLLSLLIDKFI